MRKAHLLTEDMLFTIHKAIHSTDTEVVVEGKTYPIKGGKLRFIDFGDTRVMEQNPTKGTPTANRAKNGEKLTWAMTYPNWVLIEDTKTNLKPFTYVMLDE